MCRPKGVYDVAAIQATTFNREGERGRVEVREEGSGWKEIQVAVVVDLGVLDRQRAEMRQLNGLITFVRWKIRRDVQAKREDFVDVESKRSIDESLRIEL